MELFDMSYYTKLLKSCNTHKSINVGKQLHVLFLKKGILNCALKLGNTMLQMYIRCGTMADACKLFDEMPQRNCFTWNTMVEGYMRLGERKKSLGLFEVMPYRDGFSWGVVISGFAKAGELGLARRLFDRMDVKDGVALNSMIHGYARCGYSREALKLFKGVDLDCGGGTRRRSDGFVLATVIGVCSDLGAVECGKQVHARVLVDGVEFDSVLGSSLVNLYSKCGEIDYARHVLYMMREVDDFSLSALITGYANAGRMEDARRIFDERLNPCIVVWNSLISGFVMNNKANEAFVLFKEMRTNGFNPDFSTFSSVLSACSSTGAVYYGKQLHAQLCKVGASKDVIVACSLIDMYSKCNNADEACKFFNELELHDTVLLNSMINAYNNCGRTQEARRVFDSMRHKTLITWNSMLAGLNQNGFSHLALNLFCEMNRLGIRMDKYTFTSVISSCANITLLEFGEQVFARATVVGLETDVMVCTSLIDLHCKCGFVNLGRLLFDGMVKSDEVSWNSMLTGYATNGHAIEVLNLFNNMRQAGIQPNGATFTIVLSACNHCGLIDDARKWFHLMQSDYRIEPEYEHYSCMVDLLARAGFLEEARNLIAQMPFEADATIWSSVLRGCLAHGNKSLGKEVANIITGLDPENSSAYVQLSGMFATWGDWEGSDRIRDIMRTKCIDKNPGFSW